MQVQIIQLHNYIIMYCVYLQHCIILTHICWAFSCTVNSVSEFREGSSRAEKGKLNFIDVPKKETSKLIHSIRHQIQIQWRKGKNHTHLQSVYPARLGVWASVSTLGWDCNGRIIRRELDLDNRTLSGPSLISPTLKNMPLLEVPLACEKWRSKKVKDQVLLVHPR